MDYVTYNDAGALTGSFSQDISPEHLTCYIPVTAAQRQNWTAYRANSGRTGVELIPSAPPNPAPTAVPIAVPMLSLMMAVIDAGLMSAVDAHFASLTDAVGERARARLAYSPTARRDCDMVLSVATALGKTPADIDAIFVAAAVIQ
jgi:hypothetical protein